MEPIFKGVEVAEAEGSVLGLSLMPFLLTAYGRSIKHIRWRPSSRVQSWTADERLELSLVGVERLQCPPSPFAATSAKQLV